MVNRDYKEQLSRKIEGVYSDLEERIMQDRQEDTPGRKDHEHGRLADQQAEDTWKLFGGYREDAERGAGCVLSGDVRAV